MIKLVKSIIAAAALSLAFAGAALAVPVTYTIQGVAGGSFDDGNGAIPLWASHSPLFSPATRRTSLLATPHSLGISISVAR